ncbi:MAG: multifunctional oxoglutarate decarboxylase/oxoglutarate dehydrogenase thiamine pyrophosphate-binding subunit/dihydrolipoyllysine-residue succinyltransferase subunit [Candidatus Kapabacteria bacterium]|nr:multifunctional oxoglutarate decarboxylase/oxoglutarate dehydrogenase thiamine pyrophosphate-binding subunit/dihydrolipoyllysine-residue succinyltransferase subunit [Candidatus Kapabacteria bacterium]
MMSMNSAFVDELYFEYLRDPDSVAPEWRAYFQSTIPDLPAPSAAPLELPKPVSNGNGIAEVRPPVASASPAPAAPAASATPAHSRAPVLLPGDQLVPLSSIGGKIAENMMNSLSVPTATSVRAIPVKALEENRRLLNLALARRRGPKLSFTHILAWAIVKAIEKTPNMKNSYAHHDGAHVRVQRGGIHLGLAVDTTRKDGSRILLVPSIKNCEKLTFAEFAAAYDELIAKSRTNKLTPEDLSGANVTLTNPGMIGTVMSVPRLMEGQGTIVAAGSIEYPAEFQAMMPDVLATLAVSKTVTITSTYDHRVIQGAESGEFLQTMHHLLLGEHRFYNQIFASMGVPFEPVAWTVERSSNPFLPSDQPEIIDKEGRVVQLINAYRVRGHLKADINPLGLEAYYYPELDPAHYDFTVWDLDRQFDTGGLGGVKRATLRDIIDALRDTYCDKIGIEYVHMQDPAKKGWVRTYVENSRLKVSLSAQEKLDTFRKLAKAELLENFLQTKFLGAKRFSLEGGESTLIILDQLLENASESNLSGVVLGMAHRGRLNVLANLMRKPLEKIFNEFEGVLDPETFQGSGDVKYHLGARGTYRSEGGAEIHMVLAPNPSHLEAVNPVVEGIARALDVEINDDSCSRVLPILIHGDAAFAGQGVVPETLNMARLRGYHTGGTVHVIINNQIGFTTSPEDARSTHYATGVAKMLQVPILHVNGDDPEACRAAAMFAFAYREMFKDDVVIDMYCYRKYGHNEQDDPTATQPLLYRKIRNMVPVRKQYGSQLVATKVALPEALESIVAEEQGVLEKAFDNRSASGTSVFTARPVLAYDMFEHTPTNVHRSTLDAVTSVICTVPEGFNIHAKVKAELDKRKKQYDEGHVQWGMAEALAWGSLLLEGHPVRITGQDSGRGTFNHRQAVQTDIVNETEYVPLNHLGAPVKLQIHDSSLSEYAVMGFEYGYSTIAKNGVTLWEAQFGDFANGAQIMIDQFISSAEEKWGQRSNLTLLLPHGYDGQGPEHSSARLERFLQLCAEDNMIVANFTSPANYFHALRRQVKAEWRKPLVIMTPKGYLRIFTSELEELVHGRYQEIIDDATIQDPATVQRIVLTTGKLHFELAKKRSDLNAAGVALVRVEQIHPFNEARMKEILEKYNQATEIVWCQEEPKNMGAWFFIQPILSDLLRVGQRLSYIGRHAAASPATGSAKLHEKEQEALIAGAFAVLK